MPKPPSQPATLTDQVADVLAAFEQATGLYICVRELGPHWIDPQTGSSIIPSTYRQHRSAFCMKVKEKQTPACMRCDVRDLYRDCHAEALGRVRMCHAGVNELLIPIRRLGSLSGVIFVGQFQSRTRFADLRVLGKKEQQSLKDLTLPLQSYFQELLTKLDNEAAEPVFSKRGQIEHFIRTQLGTDPTLAMLADHLSLSVSRTGHLVREETGLSFRDLKEQQRLNVACDLLATTNAKIAHIAREAGFADSDYFCRYFKQKVGKTPTGYRQKNLRVGRV